MHTFVFPNGTNISGVPQKKKSILGDQIHGPDFHEILYRSSFKNGV
jgi:hypothetical protein